MHNLEESDANYERNYLDSNEELKNWLKKISRLGFGSFEPLILTILYKRKEYDIDNEKLLETFKEIEKCLFLVFGLSPHQATLESSTIYNFARWFYYKEMNLDYIKDEVRKICRQHFDLENFYSHINKKDNVFFGWNKLRYFLFEYEESLIPKSQGEKIGWKNFTKPYQKEHETIEHILPQTPNEDWKRILNNTDGVKGKQESKRSRNIKKLTHALGNLVLKTQACLITHLSLKKKNFLQAHMRK